MLKFCGAFLSALSLLLFFMLSVKVCLNCSAHDSHNIASFEKHTNHHATKTHKDKCINLCLVIFLTFMFFVVSFSFAQTKVSVYHQDKNLNYLKVNLFRPPIFNI